MHRVRGSVEQESVEPPIRSKKATITKVLLTIFVLIAIQKLGTRTRTPVKTRIIYGDRYFGCTDECYRNKEVCLGKVKDYGNSQRTRTWYRKCSGIYIKLCIAMYRNCLKMCKLLRHGKRGAALNFHIHFVHVLYRRNNDSDGDLWEPWTDAFALCNRLVQ